MYDKKLLRLYRLKKIEKLMKEEGLLTYRIRKAIEDKIRRVR